MFYSVMDQEVKEILLNGMEIPFFIAMLLMAFAGAIVFFLWEVIKAIKYDIRTPKKFDFKTMLKMSFLRFLIALIVIPFSVIYFGDISKFIFQLKDPLEVNGFAAFMMGMSIDRFIEAIVGGSKESIEFLKGKL